MKNGKQVDWDARLARLEAEMKEIKALLQAQQQPKKPWWEEIAGTFANDPIYEEIINLGLEVREKDREKARRAWARADARAKAKKEASGG
jgi:hypothetical protein